MKKAGPQHSWSLITDLGVVSSIVAGSYTFLEIYHEIYILYDLSPPCADSRRAVVSYKQMCMHWVLVNLQSLPRKKVWLDKLNFWTWPYLLTGTLNHKPNKNKYCLFSCRKLFKKERQIWIDMDTFTFVYYPQDFSKASRIYYCLLLHVCPSVFMLFYLLLKPLDQIQQNLLKDLLSEVPGSARVCLVLHPSPRVLGRDWKRQKDNNVCFFVALSPR